MLPMQRALQPQIDKEIERNCRWHRHRDGLLRHITVEWKRVGVGAIRCGTCGYGRSEIAGGGRTDFYNISSSRTY